MHKRPEHNGRDGQGPAGGKPVPGRPVPKNLGNSGRPRTGAARGPRDYTPAEEDEDFRPPNPKNPVAGARPAVVLGAALSILGIIALVVFPFLPVSFPTWITPALIGVILLGLLVLFLSLPSKRPPSGNGAQV